MFKEIIVNIHNFTDYRLGFIRICMIKDIFSINTNQLEDGRIIGLTDCLRVCV